MPRSDDDDDQRGILPWVINQVLPLYLHYIFQHLAFVQILKENRFSVCMWAFQDIGGTWFSPYWFNGNSISGNSQGLLNSIYAPSN